MPQSRNASKQRPDAPRRRPRLDLWLFAGVVALLNLHLVGFGSAHPFIFYPSETAGGQWWRLFTHPFVHLTFYHLALDAGAFFILYAGLSEKRLFRKLSLTGIAGLSSLTAALVLAPGFDRLGLCGLSGTAHGLMAVSGLEMIAEKKHRIAGWISFATVAAKSIVETINGQVLFEFMHMGLCGTPLAACHLGGVAGASALYFFFRAADRPDPKAFRKGAWVHHAARLYARLCYRIRFTGAERFPESGPAVIIANHVSYVDPVLIAAACPRPIRFVMHAPYFHLPVLHLFFRAVGAIPISSAKKNPGVLRRAMREIETALDSGELVCIFPEGRLTRDGRIGRFLPGVDRIVHRNPVPVVPVAISGMWGSFSSYRSGPPLKKPPRRLRAQVAVAVAAPVAPSAATAAGLRRIVSAGLDALVPACDRRRSVTTSSVVQDAWSPIRKAADCYERRC